MPPMQFWPPLGVGRCCWPFGTEGSAIHRRRRAAVSATTGATTTTTGGGGGGGGHLLGLSFGVEQRALHFAELRSQKDAAAEEFAAGGGVEGGGGLRSYGGAL